MAQGAYHDTLRALYAIEAKKGMDFRLSRLEPVLDALGRPERELGRVVHLAGTNGKGSTAAMIESAMRAGGWRTGLYTSPHLVSFRERIRIGGEPVSADDVVRLARAVRRAADAARADLTFFEIATLMALVAMRERNVDVAILEAGLGGRLDATNVVHGDIAVLTSVGIDHAEFLGDTLAAIAAEKAAIIKPGATAITGALEDAAAGMVAARVRDVGAGWLAWQRDFGAFEPLVDAQRSGRGLAGAHQAHNAALAAAAVRALGETLPVAGDALERGIVGARWAARLEVLRRRGGDGPLVLDAAHNPQAARALAASLDAVAPGRPRVLVFAAMADKDWRAMLGALAPSFDRVIVTAPAMTRAERPERFLECVPDAEVVPRPDAALARADEAASAHGTIVVAGSIFLLGALYRFAGGTLLEEDLAD